MWQGIFVEGHRNLHQTAANQGTVVLRNGAVIENALRGIRTGAPGDNWNTTGGIITAQNCTFHNCAKAVEFLAYTDVSASGFVNNNLGSFKNCTFTVDANNLFSANNTSFLDRFGDFPENKAVTRVGNNNYNIFRILHSQTDGDMYWNSDRILAALDDWTVFVKTKDGKPRGAVYSTDLNEGWSEIFGVDLARGESDPALFKELLRAALSDAKQKNGKFVTFFCEPHRIAL